MMSEWKETDAGTVRSIDTQVVDLLGTMDVDGDESDPPTEESQDRLHAKEFASREEFFELAWQIQHLATVVTPDESIIDVVIELVGRDPSIFLVLTPSHWNVRFTSLELGRTLFELREPR